MPRDASYGVQRGAFNFHVPLPSGTGAAEPVTDYVPGFAFTVEKVTFITSVVGTGTSASRTFRVLKGASTVVATATLLLADTTPVGAQKAFTVTSADATFDDDDTLTVDFASGGTAFTAGQGNLVIQYRQKPQRVA
jgi:hypothetical protein